MSEKPAGKGSRMWEPISSVCALVFAHYLYSNVNPTLGYVFGVLGVLSLGLAARSLLRN